MDILKQYLIFTIGINFSLYVLVMFSLFSESPKWITFATAWTLFYILGVVLGLMLWTKYRENKDVRLGLIINLTIFLGWVIIGFLDIPPFKTHF